MSPRKPRKPVGLPGTAFGWEKRHPKHARMLADAAPAPAAPAPTPRAKAPSTKPVDHDGKRPVYESLEAEHAARLEWEASHGPDEPFPGDAGEGG